VFVVSSGRSEIDCARNGRVPCATCRWDAFGANNALNERVRPEIPPEVGEMGRCRPLDLDLIAELARREPS